MTWKTPGMGSCGCERSSGEGCGGDCGCSCDGNSPRAATVVAEPSAKNTIADKTHLDREITRIPKLAERFVPPDLVDTYDRQVEFPKTEPKFATPGQPAPVIPYGYNSGGRYWETKGPKVCTVEVWGAKLGGTYVIHTWIQVTHCDGTKERMEVMDYKNEGTDSYVMVRGGKSFGKEMSSDKNPKIVVNEPPGPRDFINTPRPKPNFGEEEEKKKPGECKLKEPCLIVDGKPTDGEICQCFTEKKARSYGAQNQYSWSGINSNTFVAQFLKHCGMKCDLPAAAWGKGVASRPDEDFFSIEPKELDDLIKAGGGTPPPGWKYPKKPKKPKKPKTHKIG